MIINRYIFFIIVIMLYSKESFALRCWAPVFSNGDFTGGEEYFTIIDNVKVFPNTPPNTEVWRGEKKSIEIKCQKNKEDGLLNKPEYIYLYPGNLQHQTIPSLSGLKVGININGINIYNEKYRTNYIVDKCYENGNFCPITTLKLNYYPIIVTSGNALKPITIKNFPLFQVDGVHGFNQSFNNFRTWINNINNISIGKCSANLIIPDKTISFGTLNKHSIYNTKISKYFDMIISRRSSPENFNCPLSIYKAFVTSPDSLLDRSFLSLYDSAGKKINMGIVLSYNSKEITLGDTFDIFPKQTIYDGDIKIKFNAKLLPLNGGLIPGNFSGKANFNIIYN